MLRHKLQKAIARSLIGLMCMQSIVPTTVYAQAVVKEQTGIVIEEEMSVSVSVEADERRTYLFTPTSDDRYLINFQDDTTDERMRVKVTAANGEEVEADYYYCTECNGLKTAAYDMSAGEQYTIEIYDAEERSINTFFMIQKSEVDSLELLALPENRTYRKGSFSTISFYGLQVKINYRDGREPELKELDYEPDGLYIGIDEKASEEPWFEVTGEHIVAVRYQGVKTTFTIDVVEANDMRQDISLGETVSYIVNDIDRAYYSFTTKEAGVYLLTIPNDPQIRTNIQKVEDGDSEDIYDINYPESYYDRDDFVKVLQLEEDTNYVVEVYASSSNKAEGTLVIDQTDVKKIEVETMPNKTVYYKGTGSYIELNGLELKVEYTNGKSEIIEYAEELGIGYQEVCEPDPEEGSHEWSFDEITGEHLIGLQYRGVTTQFKVTVTEDPVSDITIKTNPDKLVYYKDVDKNIILDGLELNINMTDGSTKIESITNDMVSYVGVYESEEDMMDWNEAYDWYRYEDEYFIRVTYQRREISFKITVQDLDITDVKIISEPNKMTYTQFLDDTLDFTGIEFELYQDDKVVGVVTEEAIHGYSISPSDWYEIPGSYTVNLTVAEKDLYLKGLTVAPIQNEFQNATDTLQLNDEIKIALDAESNSKIFKVTPAKTADYMLRIDFETVIFPFPSPYVLDQDGNSLGKKIGNDQNELCYVRLEAGQTYYYAVRLLQMEGQTATISLKEGTIQSFDYVDKSLPEQLVQTLYNDVDLYLYNGKFLITNTDGSTLECDYDYEDGMRWEFATKVNTDWGNTPGIYKVNVTFMNKTAVYPFEVVSLKSCAEAMDTLTVGETYYVEYEENAAESFVKVIPEEGGFYELKTDGLGGYLGDVIDSTGKDIIVMSAPWTEDGFTSIMLELVKGKEYYIRRPNSDYSITIDPFDISTVQSIESIDSDYQEYLQYRDTKLNRYSFYFNVALEGKENREYRISETYEGIPAIEDWYKVPGTHNVYWNVLGRQVEYPIHVTAAKTLFDSAIEVKEGIPTQSTMQDHKWEGYFYKFIPETTGYYKSVVEAGEVRVNGWVFDENGKLMATNDPYAIAKLEQGKTYYINLRRIESDSDYSLTVTKLKESELEDAGYIEDHAGNFKLSTINAQVFTGYEIKPELELTRNGVRLVEDVDYQVRFYDNVAAGKAKAIIQIPLPERNSATIVKTFDIAGTALYDALFEETEFVYTGSAIAPKPYVINSFYEILTENVDYTLEYSDDLVNVGEKTVKVNGIGSYTGSLEVTYTIHQAKLSDTTISGIPAQTYTGNAITPAVTVTKGTTLLKAGIDYSISYTGNVVKGIATVTITGKGNYTGTVQKTFVINAKPMSQVTISNIPAQTYTGKALTPAITVKNRTTLLKAGSDYTVIYTGNVAKGVATVTITGKGNYTGTVKKTFVINPKPMSQVTVSNIAAQTYTGKALTPAVTVKNGTTLLKAGTDYAIAYTGNVAKGTTTVTITGKGNYTGTVKKTFVIKAKPVSQLTVNKISNATYTGKEIKPSVTVKNGTTALRINKDYKVSYKNNKNVGYATIVITGIGNFTGTRNISFTIAPKKLTSVKASSKKSKEITVSWSKDSQVTGYEIIYATDSKQTKNKKIVDVKKNNTISYTLKNLKKNQNYYVSVRSYKKVSSGKIYSATSKVLSVKCK